MCMPGERACFDGGRTARKCVSDDAGCGGQLGPGEQLVADAIRDSVLRYRADGDGGLAARHGAVWGRGDAVQPAAVRPVDCGGTRGGEDLSGAAAGLGTEAGAEGGRFDGGGCGYGWRG